MMCFGMVQSRLEFVAVVCFKGGGWVIAKCNVCACVGPMQSERCVAGCVGRCVGAL